VPFFLEAVITQIGPGMVHLEFRLFGGRINVIETVTPVGPLLQRANHICYADWWVPRFVAKFILTSLLIQFERDVPIWSNKRLLRKPMVMKEDGQVVKFRRYFQQFYCKNDEAKRDVSQENDADHDLTW